MQKTSASIQSMNSLQISEIKAFVPAKDFALSKSFYQALGFTMGSDSDGIAYFHFCDVSFLLQDFCPAGFAENFMMHILVKDVHAWYDHVAKSQVAKTFGVRVTKLAIQPWRMKDFCLDDPSGVLWRIGQNWPVKA